MNHEMREAIATIEIDGEGRLVVALAGGGSASYQHIYREAAEVRWDAGRKAFTAPKPRERSYADWFRAIVAATRNCGIELALTPETEWVNVPDGVRREITGPSSAT